MTDNRAMRRRQTMREMHALLERFTHACPLTVDPSAGDISCAFCSASFVTVSMRPEPYAPDCVWREAREFLAKRRALVSA